MDSASGWTIDTLRTYLETLLRDLSAKLDERYATQTKATDAAFVAQQTAMKTAFDAADKAVQAALTASKEASDKAETAAGERFRAGNEFRGQLSDQARTFLPRAEYESAHRALVDKLDEGLSRLTERMNTLELRLTSRLDLGAGKDQGVSSSVEDIRWQTTFAQAQDKAATQGRHSQIALVIAAISALAALATVLFVTLH